MAYRTPGKSAQNAAIADDIGGTRRLMLLIKFGDEIFGKAAVASPETGNWYWEWQEWKLVLETHSSNADYVPYAVYDYRNTRIKNAFAFHPADLVDAYVALRTSQFGHEIDGFRDRCAGLAHEFSIDKHRRGLK